MIATEFFTKEELDLFIDMYKVYQLPKYQNDFKHGCRPTASSQDPYQVEMNHYMDNEGMYHLSLQPCDGNANWWFFSIIFHYPKKSADLVKDIFITLEE